MRLTGKRLLLALAVLAAALIGYFLLRGDENALPLQVQVTGTVNGTQARGAGVAGAPFGNLTFSASGSAQAELNCVTFDGTGVLATAAGTLQLRLPKPGRACFTAATLQQAEGGADVEVTATVEASGSDGSLLGRHGRLKARGSFNPDSGRFIVTFSGGLRH